jgi:hypothetical protein
MIANITDENGVVQETSHGIIRTFFNHMRRKYDDVSIDEASLRFMESIQGDAFTKEQQDSLSAPITCVEVRKAVFGEARNKAPGLDGISPEFYCDTWDDMEDMGTPVSTYVRYRENKKPTEARTDRLCTQVAVAPHTI